jgi:hypothetical protein
MIILQQLPLKSQQPLLGSLKQDNYFEATRISLFVKEDFIGVGEFEFCWKF